MRERKLELPKCTPPSVKLVGRGDKGGDELAITAEVPFHFALDGYSTYAPVFLQPDSDIQCLLGVHVIPSLDIRVKCDRLVEKFNSMLINLLSKSVGKYGNN